MCRANDLTMTNQTSSFSDGFQRLYCDESVFAAFSALHPISFARVLPFQADDPVADYQVLIDAETAYLAARNDGTRRNVIGAYSQCGLLPEAEAANLSSVDTDFDAEFFETMGTTYANAGMFICALRWYREYIAELEAQERTMRSDTEGVYASVGYCLYSLGLYPEAIAWSKCCIGPNQMADTICRALLGYEAQLGSGAIRGVERVGQHTRYLVAAFDPAAAAQAEPRIKTAMQTIAPFLNIYLNWLNAGTPAPEIQPEGYPFNAERESGNLTRHRTNLIFATCNQADALTARGFVAEAKRLLFEAAIMEPEAAMVRDKINALPPSY